MSSAYFSSTGTSFSLVVVIKVLVRSMNGLYAEHGILDKRMIFWQGWADDLRTIRNDKEVDVKAIRDLLDDDGKPVETIGDN